MKISSAFAATFAAVACQGAPLRHARTAALPLVGYLNKDALWYKAPYSYGARDAASIVGSVDALIYKSLTIEDTTFTISNDNQQAGDEYQTLNNYKLSNPDLQVLVSVGGPMLPSSTWSQMVATESYRASFIASAIGLLDAYSFNGIELDWVFPCSPAKSIWIEFGTDTFREIVDKGSSCPTDVANLVLLLKELRTAIGDTKSIVMTLPAEAAPVAAAIADILPFVDHFTVKAYGYSVSSDPVTGGTKVTAPFQPLVAPSGISGINSTGSVTKTIADYSTAGISGDKLIVIMPAFGTTYYIPEVVRDGWDVHGVAAKQSGACFGPFEKTYGAFPNGVDKHCGFISYHEYLSMLATEGGPAAVQDSATKASIGFLPGREAFVSFTGPAAIASIVTAAQGARVGGIGVESIDQDSYDTVSMKKDYALVLAACKAMFGDTAARCAETKTTTFSPPTNGTTSCDGHADGTYCMDEYEFLVCPPAVRESCAPGTVCKQDTATAIACDWPSTLH